MVGSDQNSNSDLNVKQILLSKEEEKKGD